MDKATQQFKERLERLAAETGLDNATGLFPLDSEFRRLGISYSTLFGAARALLLQIAHPTVAQGVFEFSDFRGDPVGRGIRTFLGVFMVGIGTQANAIKTGVHIFERHRPIKGTIPAWRPDLEDRPYSALEPGANLWVWATLVEGILFGHQEVHHPVGRDRLERFYEETKLFGLFFNVKPHLIPETLADFEAYFEETIQQTLYVTPAGQQVGDALVKAYEFPFRQSGWMLRAFAAESLPDVVRDGFGWRSTPQTRLAYQAFRRAFQAYYAVAPPPWQVIPLAYGPNIRKSITGELNRLPLARLPFRQAA